AVQLGIELGKPFPTFALAAHGEVGRIAFSKRSVGQAPEMRPIETNLHDVGLHVLDKWQIAGIAVTSPVGDEATEFEARGGCLAEVLSLAGEKAEGAGQEEQCWHVEALKR